MPIDVYFDEDRRLLYVTLAATWPTLPEILDQRAKLLFAGMIRPGVVALIDARAVVRGIPNLSEMQAILHAIPKPPHKRALLVSSTVQLAAGRLAELLDPKGLKVFRDHHAAVLWLLLDDEAIDPPVKFDRSRSGRIATVRKESAGR